MAEVKSHVLTVSNKKYAISVGDEYAEIGVIVGIVPATDESLQNIDDGGEVDDLLRAGKVFKLRVSGKNAAGKNKRTDIYCAADKVGAAKGGLIGKAIKGTGDNASSRFTIKRAYFPTYIYLR